VFGSLAFLAVWMTANALLAAHGGAFDRYPFILLNLVLSCVAALQGAILLIAAKRSDQVSSELAQHDYEADCASQEMLATLTAEFAALRMQHAEQSKQLATLIAAVGLPVSAVEVGGERGPELMDMAPDAAVQPPAPRASRRRATGGGKT
jgi:uncharacterized membrane protein